MMNPTNLNNEGPMTAPPIPATITKAAANAGEPPIESAISIATGEVTDLGKSEKSMNLSNPSHFPEK